MLAGTKRLVGFCLWIGLTLLVSCSHPLEPIPWYDVTYDANGATQGVVPDSEQVRGGAAVTVAFNTGHLARTDFDFIGWNAEADGSGEVWAEGSRLVIAQASVTLYAQWRRSTQVVIAGGTYPVVDIGTRQWTATNHAGPGGRPFREGLKPEYGRYYLWTEVATIALPAGWRIPTIADYQDLASSQGVVFTGTSAHSQSALGRLVSTNHWLHVPGTNASGFNAFPTGYSYNGSDPIDGDIAEFWVASAVSASIQETALGSHRMGFYDSSSNPYQFTIRFVRDRAGW